MQVAPDNSLAVLSIYKHILAVIPFNNELAADDPTLLSVAQPYLIDLRSIGVRYDTRIYTLQQHLQHAYD